jgi:glycine/D-amino acid oxidase-like deaminating enzyme
MPPTIATGAFIIGRAPTLPPGNFAQKAGPGITSCPKSWDSDIELRELDLLLTVFPGQDPQALATQFEGMATPPQLISTAQAQELEPLLDGSAIAAAFHRSPWPCFSSLALVAAYNQAFQRLGGTRIIATVTGLVRLGTKVTGITTAQQAYPAQQVLVAAGAFSRRLLHDIGLAVPIYHTHAELITTPPLGLSLRTVVTEANLQRWAMEAQASQPETEALWDRPDREIVPPILDSGALQFQDGHLCIGQISRTLTAIDAPVDADESEQTMRQAIARPLPSLAKVPGQWHRVLVSFSRDGLPLVGPVLGVEGLQMFTGFSSPFIYVPPIAQRFAQAIANRQPDHILESIMRRKF